MLHGPPEREEDRFHPFFVNEMETSLSRNLGRSYTSQGLGTGSVLTSIRQLFGGSIFTKGKSSATSGSNSLFLQEKVSDQPSTSSTGSTSIIKTPEKTRKRVESAETSTPSPSTAQLLSSKQRTSGPGSRLDHLKFPYRSSSSRRVASSDQPLKKIPEEVVIQEASSVAVSSFPAASISSTPSCSQASGS